MEISGEKFFFHPSMNGFTASPADPSPRTTRPVSSPASPQRLSALHTWRLPPVFVSGAGNVGTAMKDEHAFLGNRSIVRYE